MEKPMTEDMKVRGEPPSYEPLASPSAAVRRFPHPTLKSQYLTNMQVQSKAITVELINCAPKGLSATGAVLTGRVLNTLTDIVTINPSTTYSALSDLIMSRGESRAKTRDVFPAVGEGEGRHMVIRLLLGEKSILVDEDSWSDCRVMLLDGGDGVKSASLKCYFAKTPVGWEKTAKRFGRPGTAKEKKRCVVQ